MNRPSTDARPPLPPPVPLPLTQPTAVHPLCFVEGFERVLVRAAAHHLHPALTPSAWGRMLLGLDGNSAVPVLLVLGAVEVLVGGIAL